MKKGNSLNLYTLNRTGLLTKETTHLLTYLDKENNWEIAKLQLYNSGYVPSENRNHELFLEIKNRFVSTIDNLPNIKVIKKIAKSNINPISKAEIYFVYLYHSNEIVKNVVQAIYDIYDHNKDNLILERKTVEQLLRRYIKIKESKIKKNKIAEKTIQNWIGKFISILNEVGILRSRNKNTSIITVGGLATETCILFLMDAWFSEYELNKGGFMEAFHVSLVDMHTLIENSKLFDSGDYSDLNFSPNQGKLFYKPKFESITDWLMLFDNE